ncbi:hypothetical protein GF407_15510 [candidate division KSB1 bacterium]|nr:hypothetical protein [candidate division KSB1 bacterium]
MLSRNEVERVKMRLYFIIFALALCCFCGKEKAVEPEEKILVKIDDKSISVNEFIRRAEYSIRPSYCGGSHNLDKKIVLNSLIAEKLLSIQAGDSNAFITSDRIERYLRGRKEQSMRQWLYQEEGLRKATIDTARALKVLDVAGRRYNISYFNLPDSTFIAGMRREMRQGRSYEEVYYNFTGLDSLPQRQVEWSVNEHDHILDSLFMAPLQKNQIVGPVRTAEDEYLLLKINGWVDRPAITEAQSRERWRDIINEYKQRSAAKVYENFVKKVMKGKKIEFNPDIFFKITEFMGPLYFSFQDEKIEIMKKSYWEQENHQEELQQLQEGIEDLYPEPLFKVDDEVWTVEDFVNELDVHPLVFRRQRMKKNEFGQQLQFAIIDMVRDRYLADVAYKRGYDGINVIERNIDMFRDNLNYQYQRSRYLNSIVPDSIGQMPVIPLIEDYPNPYVDSLQSKYADRIRVNVEEFNDIQLTRIDMSVTQKNVPFPKLVPSFPLITSDSRLDYGRKMDESKKSKE